MNHIGFGLLESLLNSHHPDLPVYLLLITENVGHQAGRRNFYVHVSDLDFDMRVGRYCRIHVGASDTIYDEPVQRSECDRIYQQALNAQHVVEVHIRAVHKFTIQSAAVTLPKDVSLVIGGTDCMCYDKGRDLFVMADLPATGAAA